jgi:signal transduction histidine kinase
MKFTDRVYEQFGPYRKRCAELICNSSKAGLASVPERIHGLKFATIKDLSCIANGDEYCEWEFSWIPQEGWRFVWPLTGLLAGAVTFAYLHLRYPAMTVLEELAIALLPGIALWHAIRSRRLRNSSRAREALIQEQLRFVEARHEELREAYLEQERTSVELRRKVGQLTTLQHAGLLFGATLDRETLLQRVLEAIIHELHYDRVMLTLYDPVRKVSHDARILGVPEEIAAFARSLEVPVTDPETLEGTVLLRGLPVLIHDVRKESGRIHPLNQQLAAATNARSIISVPLKSKDQVRGALTVDRNQENGLTQDDVDLLMTLAGQVAIALDNTDAYRMIETLNVGLEQKVQERTTSLEEVNRELGAANTQLRELNHLKSAFVSIVSHELRTPMTSIKGYVENMLEGLTGELSEKQRYYLTRVKHNTERLTRMIGDLLDLSRIEAGRVELKIAPLVLEDLVAEVVEGFQTIAREKAVTVHASSQNSLPKIDGDRDKLHQVLTNLIQNAVKFTPKGGKVWVETRLDDDGFVECCVADTGCGIPLDELDKVFEKFYRGESVPADARGAGLGLAITKTLVELHRGRIWVESTPGEGSRFFYTLPVESTLR